MIAALKLSVLFVSGLAVGLVLPVGPQHCTAKRTLPQPDKAMTPPTALTLRCIVEQQSGQPAARMRLGRWLPQPDEEGPAAASDPQVEVIVRPAPVQETKAKEVHVILRVAQDGSSTALRTEGRQMPVAQ
jgi:hypothetical protein